MAKKRKETERTRKLLNGIKNSNGSKTERIWNGHGKMKVGKVNSPLQTPFGQITTKHFYGLVGLDRFSRKEQKEWKEMETQKRKDN